MKVLFSATYENRVRAIEDFIFVSSDDDLGSLTKFLDAHDRAIEFIRENPETPLFHPATGDRSWIFGEGRYRMFYVLLVSEIVLLDIIDNRMSNLRVYPGNSLPTYDEE